MPTMLKFWPAFRILAIKIFFRILLGVISHGTNGVHLNPWFIRLWISTAVLFSIAITFQISRDFSSFIIIYFDYYSVIIRFYSSDFAHAVCIIQFSSLPHLFTPCTTYRSLGYVPFCIIRIIAIYYSFTLRAISNGFIFISRSIRNVLSI